MDSRSLQIILSVVDNATSAFKKVSAGLDDFSKKFEKQAEASRTFALGLAGAGVAVAGFGGMAIKAAMDLEQMQIAFSTMLGSAQKADVFLRDLVNFAKTTPFELTGLQQSAKQLLAYGFAQEEVIPNLKALGDIASGVGMDKLPNLILAFGQVRAATKLTGMELRQFTEAGVPLLAELAKQLETTPAKIQEMISAGEIGFPEVQKALMSMTQEGGRFNNLMDNQSKSLAGMISNLKDAWNIFLMGEGQKLLEWGKQFVTLAIDIVQNHLPNWINKIGELTTWFKEHEVAIYLVSGAIIGALVPAIVSAVVAFASLAVTLAPFILGGAIIGGLVAAVVWWVKNWQESKETIVWLWEGLKAEIKRIWDGIKNYFSDIWENIKETFKSAIDWIMGKIQPFLDAVEKVKSAAASVGNFIGNTASSAWSGLKNVIGFAEGGIVTQPTFAMVGEAGPEAIIPLSRLSAVGAGGVNISVVVNGDVSGQELVNRVQEAIMNGLRMNSKLPL